VPSTSIHYRCSASILLGACSGVLDARPCYVKWQGSRATCRSNTLVWPAVSIKMMGMMTSCPLQVPGAPCAPERPVTCVLWGPQPQELQGDPGGVLRGRPALSLLPPSPQFVTRWGAIRGPTPQHLTVASSELGSAAAAQPHIRWESQLHWSPPCPAARCSGWHLQQQEKLLSLHKCTHKCQPWTPHQAAVQQLWTFQSQCSLQMAQCQCS
jgi:hypothetical protein